MNDNEKQKEKNSKKGIIITVVVLCVTAIFLGLGISTLKADEPVIQYSSIVSSGISAINSLKEFSVKSVKYRPLRTPSKSLYLKDV